MTCYTTQAHGAQTTKKANIKFFIQVLQADPFTLLPEA
jgi:hypothetical protein